MAFSFFGIREEPLKFAGKRSLKDSPKKGIDNIVPKYTIIMCHGESEAKHICN